MYREMSLFSTTGSGSECHRGCLDGHFAINNPAENEHSCADYPSLLPTFPAGFKPFKRNICCGFCDVLFPYVDVYYWPEPTANFSCLNSSQSSPTNVTLAPRNHPNAFTGTTQASLSLHRLKARAQSLPDSGSAYVVVDQSTLYVHHA